MARDNPFSYSYTRKLFVKLVRPTVLRGRRRQYQLIKGKRDRDSETNRQRDRQTDRQRQRQTETERDRDRDRDRVTTKSVNNTVFSHWSGQEKGCLHSDHTKRMSSGLPRTPRQHD